MSQLVGGAVVAVGAVNSEVVCIPSWPLEPPGDVKVRQLLLQAVLRSLRSAVGVEHTSLNHQQPQPCVVTMDTTTAPTSDVAAAPAVQAPAQSDAGTPTPDALFEQVCRDFFFNEVRGVGPVCCCGCHPSLFTIAASRCPPHRTLWQSVCSTRSWRLKGTLRKGVLGMCRRGSWRALALTTALHRVVQDVAISMAPPPTSQQAGDDTLSKLGFVIADGVVTLPVDR